MPFRSQLLPAGLRSARGTATLLLAGLAWLLAAPALAAISFVSASTTPAPASNAVASVTVNTPASIVAGDVLLAQVAVRGGSGATLTAPSGWTLVLRTNSTTTLGQATYYRIATASEPASYTWGVAPSDRVAAAIIAYRGVHPSAPIGVSGGQAAVSATITAPAVTTSVAGSEVVRLYSTANGGASITLAGGATARFATVSTGAGPNGVAIRAASNSQASNGSTGSQNATSSSAVAGIGQTVALTPAGPANAEWRFDETTWPTTVGAVTDSGTGAYSATAVNGPNTANVTPAIAGSPGTCRYGVFDGSNDYVQLPAGMPRPVPPFTISAWIRTTVAASGKDQRIFVDDDSADGYALSLGDSGTGAPHRLRFFVRRPSTVIADSGAVVQANQWYFVAAAVSVGTGGTAQVYVFNAAGTLLSTVSVPLSAFLPGTGRMAIGGELDGASDGEGVARWRFQGNIDEVRLSNSALTQAQLQALAATTRSCPLAIDHFRVVHDGYGIRCAGEQVTVSLRDASNNLVTGYTGATTLTTQTGRGTWTLVAGAGAFADATADDGLATYSWAAGESQATFSLQYPTGASPIDVDVFETATPALRDDDVEGALAFSPSAFTVTSAALSNPPPASIPLFGSPQTAGTNVPVHLTAYGQTANDPVCGVIEEYSGAKNLRFWTAYLDPASGTRQATVNGTSVATSEGAAAAQAVAFTNGQAVVTLKYKDVGLMSLQMKDDTAGNPSLPSGIRGSTGGVVMKPADFAISGVQRAADAFANPGAAAATGPVFMAAGQPFRATVTVIDAEGTATPNYGRESSSETVRLTPALVLPAGGANPALSNATAFGAFAGGVATGATFAWPEVGIITLAGQVGDADYLGGGNAIGTGSGNVGRFVPYDFAATANTPLFTTGCGTGSFTYLGQPFGYSVPPVLTATARAFGGATTTNYRGAFFKLTNASLGARSYAAASGTLDTTGLPAAASDPAIIDNANGTATLTFSAGTGLAFTRSTPLAPFTAEITLSVGVADSDGVVYATNPFVFGTAGGIGFTAGAEQRYGRIVVGTAVGSELLDLPVPLQAEYYAGAAGFAPNTADACTAGITLTLRDYAAGLAAGETCVRDAGSPGVSGAGCAAAAPVGSRYTLPLSLGRTPLILAAPGAGNLGSVTVEAVVPDWLQFDWLVGTPGLENPAGRATFGVFQGLQRRIYEREIN